MLLLKMEESNPYRDLIAARIDAFGGTAITASQTRLRVGSSQDVTWVSESLSGSNFRQHEVVLREASRAEYDAFPWPLRHVEHSEDWSYWEIGFD